MKTVKQDAGHRADNMSTAVSAGGSQQSESVQAVAQEILEHLDELELVPVERTKAWVTSKPLSEGKSLKPDDHDLSAVLESGNELARVYARRLRQAGLGAQQAGPPPAGEQLVSKEPTPSAVPVASQARNERPELIDDADPRETSAAPATPMNDPASGTGAAKAQHEPMGRGDGIPPVVGGPENAEVVRKPPAAAPQAAVFEKPKPSGCAVINLQFLRPYVGPQQLPAATQPETAPTHLLKVRPTLAAPARPEPVPASGVDAQHQGPEPAGHQEHKPNDAAPIIGKLVPLAQQIIADVKKLALRGKAVGAARKRCNEILDGGDPSERLKAADALAAMLKKGNGKARDLAAAIIDCLQPWLPGFGNDAGSAPRSGRDEVDDTLAGERNGVAGQRPLPLSELGISRWNRSYGIPADEQYRDELVQSIRKNGLLHRATVVRDPDDAEHPYKVLAGANRVGALRQSRADDQFLHPDEYVLLDGLTEADPRCLAISLTENADRRPPSPYERAFLVQRLVDEEGMKKKDVAKAMRVDPSTISRLLELAETFDSMPKTWRQDLQRVRVLGTDQAPAVKLGHFTKVATLLVKGPPAPEVVSLMNRVHAERWSVAMLDRELKALPPEVPAPPDGGTPAGEQGGAEDNDREAPMKKAAGTAPPEPGAEPDPENPAPTPKGPDKPTPGLAGLRKMRGHLDKAQKLAEEHAGDFVESIAKIIEKLEKRMGRD
jgi:ParB/RepB/Spo0J family partition protein